MTLQDRLVVVAKCFSVTHRDQKWVVDARVLDVAHKARQEGTHDVEVTEMLHQIALLCEKVEVACNLHNFGQIVIRILLIRSVLDTVDE